MKEAARNLDMMNIKKHKKIYHGRIPEMKTGRIILAKERKKKACQIVDEIHDDHRKMFIAKIKEVDPMSLKMDPIKFNNEPFELDNLLWEKADDDRKHERLDKL